MRTHSISVAHRFKKLVSVCAICAVGVAGAATSHAEASQPPEGLHHHGAELQPSPAGHALGAIAGNLDEGTREVAERTGRAEAPGGREARGRELRGEDDD
ncbi:MAG: hypothetical protein ACRDLL_00645 [Solirubrobacterales bacterium]